MRQEWLDDHQTPEQRTSDAAWSDIGRALRAELQREEEAVAFLRKRGWHVIRPEDLKP